MKYCPECNYAISIVEFDHFRFNTNQVKCPRCNKALLSEFKTKDEQAEQDLNEILGRIKRGIEIYG